MERAYGADQLTWGQGYHPGLLLLPFQGNNSKILVRIPRRPCGQALQRTTRGSLKKHRLACMHLSQVIVSMI